MLNPPKCGPGHPVPAHMPTLANAEPTTLGDTTIEATTDIANCIPSPQLSLTEKQLKRFIGKVKRKVKIPLVPKPP
jgi:hypothetical protein